MARIESRIESAFRTARRPHAEQVGRGKPAGHPSRRRLATALAAVLLAGGCGVATRATPMVIGGAAPATLPLPAAVTTGAGPAASSGAPASQTCNPVASYRPPATMPTPGSMPSGSAMATIQARGKLIVGDDENTYLFGYLNAADGKVEGFDIDIAAAVAKAIFGTADGRLELKVIAYDQRIPDLENGSVDIVVDTMTENCARWQQVAFSTEYYTASQRVLTNKNAPYKSLDDLGGKKVCAETGSTSIDTIARTASHPIPIGVGGVTDCLVMLEQGEVDAISTDDAILSGLAAQDPQTHIVGPAAEPEPYGIGVGRDHVDLVRFVNGVLDQLRTGGGWAALYQEWPGRLGGTVPAPPPAVYRD
jgi:polar amino acid transport system substrate-binding protein